MRQMDGRGGPYRGEFLHSGGGVPVEYHDAYGHGGDETKAMAMGGMGGMAAAMPNALDDPNTDWAGGVAMQSLIGQYDGAPSGHHHIPRRSGSFERERGGKGVESRRRGAHGRKRGRGGASEGYGSGMGEGYGSRGRARRSLRFFGAFVSLRLLSHRRASFPRLRQRRRERGRRQGAQALRVADRAPPRVRERRL